jgi:hypothetical protein
MAEAVKKAALEVNNFSLLSGSALIFSNLHNFQFTILFTLGFVNIHLFFEALFESELVNRIFKSAQQS